MRSKKEIYFVYNKYIFEGKILRDFNKNNNIHLYINIFKIILVVCSSKIFSD